MMSNIILMSSKQSIGALFYKIKHIQFFQSFQWLVLDEFK